MEKITIEVVGIYFSIYLGITLTYIQFKNWTQNKIFRISWKHEIEYQNNPMPLILNTTITPPKWSLWCGKSRQKTMVSLNGGV